MTVPPDMHCMQKRVKCDVHLQQTATPLLLSHFSAAVKN